MAIISASRRTDIPTYYGEWFINRLKEGYFMTRNPYNNKVTKTCFRKEDIDCIVFWTKNPIPFMKYLPDLKDVPYYFQFTLTGYGKDIEANLPDKQRLIEAFKELHDKGNGNIVWRYDPVVFKPVGEDCSPEWHIETFRKLAQQLRGYTDRCVISFVDLYSHITPMTLFSPLQGGVDINGFCKTLADIAQENGMDMFTCAESIDLSYCGIRKGKCIDPDYIQSITGKVIKANKDKGQRTACGCIESADVGVYNSCLNGCKYCYACANQKRTEACMKRYDPTSPLLCDGLRGDEPFTEKHLKAFGCDPDPEQLSLF